MTEENCREIIAVYEPQPLMKKLERMSLIGEFINSNREYDKSTRTCLMLVSVAFQET